MRYPTARLSSPDRAPRRAGPLAMLACALATACGTVEQPVGETSESLGTQDSRLVSTNGLSTNGLSTNGLSTNGLSTNGLSTNGLSTNGLSTNGLFSAWFSEDPARGDQVMRYVAFCALPSGQSMTYTYNGKTYTWTGLLGLAPGWSGGAAATLAEQQVVSACLAAHVNKYGVHVDISVLGRSATGVVIATSSEELTEFGQKEGCFFGNLFANEGLFAANDAPYLNYDQSTVRTCGLSSWSGDADCLPAVKHVGQCSTYCTLDTSRNSYSRCTYNGKAYRPITTRIRASDIYRCGDGVCQLSESCGTGTTPDSCAADCGSCQ